MEAQAIARPVILLCEHLAASVEAELAAQATVVVAPSPTEEAIVATCPEADGIVIRAKGKITARVFAAHPRLRVVGRHGIGVDHIDLAAAQSYGVTVVNTPDANSVATAEFTLGLMLATVRQIPRGDRLVRAQGAWSGADTLLGFNLAGKTLGIVGTGRVGSRVAMMGVRGFGMKLVYADHRDREHPELVELGGELLPIDRLLERADVVSLHVPLTQTSSRLLDERRLRLMKSSAVLINTSRGGVIDEEQLIDALRSGRLLAAGLDVMTVEPLRGSLLQTLDNVVLTPHMASYSSESFAAMGQVIWDVLGVLSGKAPRNQVVGPTGS